MSDDLINILDTFPKVYKFRSKNIPIELLIDYRKKQLSYSQIAKLLGVSKQAIGQRLRPLYEALHIANAYHHNKSEVLNYKQSRLLTALDEQKIKAMHGRDIAVAVGILYDKQRLEEGRSTANLDIHSFHKHIDAQLRDLDSLTRNLMDVKEGT